MSKQREPKAPLIPEYRLAIVKWLREVGPKPSVEIYDHIKGTFGSKWTYNDTELNGQGRPAWMNHVDWAKAQLNEEGLTRNGGGMIWAVTESEVRPKENLPKPTRAVKETKPKASSP